MRPLLFFLLLLGCYSTLFTQVLAVKIGMTEKELVYHSMPSRIEPMMTFQQRAGEVITYKQKIDTAYVLTLTFTIKKGIVHSIRKQHVGKNQEQRRLLYAYYKESITNRMLNTDMKENEKLARSASNGFRNRSPRAKAFNHKKLKFMEIFMFYHNKTSSVFVEIIGAT